MAIHSILSFFFCSFFFLLLLLLLLLWCEGKSFIHLLFIAVLTTKECPIFQPVTKNGFWIWPMLLSNVVPEKYLPSYCTVNLIQLTVAHDKQLQGESVEYTQFPWLAHSCQRGRRYDKPQGVTLSPDESAIVFHWCELCINYKNTSYIFTVQY